MEKPSRLIWFWLLLIIVLPTTLGRFLLDLAGGIILVFFIISFILLAIGWIGWKYLSSRLKACNSCGSISLSSSEKCPICNTDNLSKNDNPSQYNENKPASEATIDVSPKEN